MASSGDDAAGKGVFLNADPFHKDGDTQFDEIGTTVDDENRLAGVKSLDPFADDRARLASDDENAPTSVITSNPFANTESGRSEEIFTTPGSAISPGPDNHAEYFDRGVSGTHGQEQSVAGAGSGIPIATTEPIDHAVSNVNESSLSSAPTKEPTGAEGDPLEPLNSNVNGDRGERGTDIFANADPPHRESVSSKPSPSDSDSDSAIKEEKKGVTFAENDDGIEKMETQENSSDGVLDKVKSTMSKVKSKIHLDQVRATGPFKNMNPTAVRMRVKFADDPNNDVGIVWRSRDNRKGRNSIVVPRTSMAYPNLPPKNRPVYSSSFKGIRRNLYRMCFTFPYWDMAFWSGWSYTWGSVLFVIDGVWAWAPVGWNYTEPEVIPDYLSGVFFFVGALLYQLGAVIAWLEAVNDGSFHGSAMKKFLEGHEEDKKKLLDEKVKNFFGHLNPVHEKKKHEAEEAELEKAKTVDPEAGWRSVPRRERMGSIFPAGQKPGPRRGGIDLGEAEEGETHEYTQWRWWPTWHAFRYHHIYEVGYVACSIQLFGATLYSWCGMDSLHGLSDPLFSTNAIWYGAYWFPEIFGSCCFLTASVFFLTETQEAWYKPQPHLMGWWIGAWAFIGSMGFLLNGVFGVVYQQTGAEWASFQSECSTTWGSFGYLCSALCQWYEAVNKHPVEEGYYDQSGDLAHFQVHDIADMSGTVDP